MSIKIWNAMRLLKRIESKENSILTLKGRIKKYREWIKKDKKRLAKQIVQMSDDEFIMFGLKTGYLEDRKR